MKALYWLVLIIVLVVIELATVSFTTIWFAGGALVSFMLSLLGTGYAVQWIVFCVISLILLFSTRPWAMRYFSDAGKERTNVESLPGKTAVVTSEICNPEARGEVSLNGLTWTARSTDDSVTIAENTLVEVTAVEGVKLIVREKEKEEED